MATRTLSEKVADIKSTYEQYRELVTDSRLEEMMDQLTGDARQAQIASQGDVKAYMELVRASLSLGTLLNANYRAALTAATLTVSGSYRVLPTDEE